MKHRVLEVEMLEDRCTPSTVGLTGSSGLGNSSLAPTLSNGLPASFAPELVAPNGGLTIAPFFNFAAPSTENIAEFPTPAGSLLLDSVLTGNATPGTSVSGIPTAFDVANVEARAPASLEPSVLGSLAFAGLLVANPAGVPSTVAFPLPSYYNSLPLYDTAVAVPDSVEFESLSPFVSGGLGRASYEGSDGASMTAAPIKPPALPPHAAAPIFSPYLMLDLSADEGTR